MSASPHITVPVTFNRQTNQPECPPEKEWVHCFWNRPGEDTVRWTFHNFPGEICDVELFFLPFVPGKYRQGVKGFLRHQPFAGVAKEESTSGSHLPDLVTYNIRRARGYFCYALVFYDSSRNQVGVLDPGGTVDPDPPESGHP